MKIIWTESGNMLLKDDGIRLIATGKDIFIFEKELVNKEDVVVFINNVLLRKTSNQIKIDSVEL